MSLTAKPAAAMTPLRTLTTRVTAPRATALLQVRPLLAHQRTAAAAWMACGKCVYEAAPLKMRSGKCKNADSSFLPQSKSVRNLTARAAKKEDHGASDEGEVPVETDRSAPPAKKSSAVKEPSKVARTPPKGVMTQAFGSMLPAMLDPFNTNTALNRALRGPFGLDASDILHELESDLRALTSGMFEGHPGTDLQPGEEADEPTRLWAAVDVRESESEFTLLTDVPGLKKEDVKVTVHDGVLTINGERKREHVTEADGYKRIERSYGTFERRFKLPANVDADAVKADLHHGELLVHMPKVTPPAEGTKSQPKKIDIGGEGKKQ